MTKKDYDLIARALAASKPKGTNLSPKVFHACTGTWGLTVAILADLLQIHNERFNRKRFEKAVGI